MKFLILAQNFKEVILPVTLKWETSNSLFLIKREFNIQGRYIQVRRERGLSLPLVDEMVFIKPNY